MRVDTPLVHRPEVQNVDKQDESRSVLSMTYAELTCGLWERVAALFFFLLS